MGSCAGSALFPLERSPSDHRSKPAGIWHRRGVDEGLFGSRVHGGARREQFEIAKCEVEPNAGVCILRDADLPPCTQREEAQRFAPCAEVNPAPQGKERDSDHGSRFE